MLDCSKIKLVIWDLDETFWSGTLSDNNMQIINENVQLIKDMVDAGVMCSICSKNEEDSVKKVLKKLGIWDLFVFKSINWTPKGERVKQIIEEMNLRPQNVLFLDDNNSNLKEVEAFCPQIMCEAPEAIKDLVNYYKVKEKKDLKHSRLEQYKILEKKKDFRAKKGSNLDFLMSCNIRVEIKNDSLNKIERIHELILRSNQLNFTKNRATIEELENLLTTSEIRHGYVEVSDSFGEYGLVGFYAIKEQELIHFVFSCRTLNMGIEQYVYNKLGRPSVEIIGEVSSSLDQPAPEWINQSKIKKTAQKKEKILEKGKILIKGPCDMSQMFSYIQESKNIITEFVYTNDKGVSIEQGNHSSHIVQSKTLSEEEKNIVINELPFGDKDMYNTKMFDKDISAVVYSLFTDPNLGLYQKKNSEIKVAFGEYTNDLTDEKNWSDLISGKRFNANCNFTEENLNYVKNNYDFIGRLTPDQIINNLEFIYNNISQNTKLIFVLGSEEPYENNSQPAYEDRHKYNKELNEKVKTWAENKESIQLLDVNRFIDGQSKFTNNINHFTKDVYFKMSQEIINLLKTTKEVKIKQVTKFKKMTKNVQTFIKKILIKIKKTFTRQK